MDEVKVYSRTLSAGEAYQLYDGSSPEEVLQKKGITVTESMNMFVGRTETIEVNMPAVVKKRGLPSVLEVPSQTSRPSMKMEMLRRFL